MQMALRRVAAQSRAGQQYGPTNPMNQNKSTQATLSAQIQKAGEMRQQMGAPAQGGAQSPNAATQPIVNAGQQAIARMFLPGQQTPTFAQLQATGQARPAPPAQQAMVGPQAPPVMTMMPLMQAAPVGPSAGGVAASGPVTSSAQLNPQMAALASQFMANPSAYNAPQMVEAFNRLNEQLTDQFDAQRNRVSEAMAARGLDASTIHAAALGDLAKKQAWAQRDLAGQIQTDAVRDLARARNDALAAALGIRRADDDRDNAQQDRALRSRDLDIRSRQTDRELDLRDLEARRRFELDLADLLGAGNYYEGDDPYAGLL